MFGTVLPMLKRSAWSTLPSAATSSADRTKPLNRDTTVPAAITALEERIRDSSVDSAGGWWVMGCSCGSRPSYPAHQAYDDRAEQEGDPGSEDQPDHLAHLCRPDRQGCAGSE